MSLNSNPVAAGQEVFCSRTIIETSKLLLRTFVLAFIFCKCFIFGEYAV